ncbi:type II toxin-antitoxin system VapC family toxin [Rhodopila sp.]|uniref:type II toxin-antitoxin system VapC family toxin n=1 Tax=Rhodopila sp. TaxID=2480087 RepID=UPI003D0CDB79
MLILDTNVTSEMMRDAPFPAVVRWLDGQDRQTIWITAITVMELHQGVQILPPGRRRSALTIALDRLIKEKIGDRIASFDGAAARVTAAIAAERRREGRSGEVRDTMIAGIAVVMRASLATRNTSHFADLNVPLINPWTA